MTTPIAKINLEPEEPAIDARLLDKLLDHWLLACSQKAEAYTVAGYRDKVAHFRRWWAVAGAANDWILTPSLCVAFELDLRTAPGKTGKPLSYYTRYNIIRQLRSALKWALDTGRLPVDCRAWFPSPEGEATKRAAATLGQLEHLMECAGESPSPVRDQTILAILIGTGLRRTECARLQVEDIAFNVDGTGLANVIGKRTRTNRSGQRQVALDTVTVAYLKRHLGESGLTTGALFRRKRGGGKLGAVGLYRIVKNAAGRAGLDARIQGCHDLRRTFCTHFARQHPGDIYADMLRRQLGHKHFRQTAHYSLMDADDLRSHITSPLAAGRGMELAS